MTRSVIMGIGSYLPERVMHNNDLAAMVDTSDAWIKERSGIENRHIAEDGQWTSDLATRAAKAALDDAGVKSDAIDIVIVATTTPDRTFPATAVRVQHLLGMDAGAAFDIQAVCSGFLYGLHVADSLIVSGRARRIVLIGAETVSRIIDWGDRSTCILFGDGAGAVVLEAGGPNDRNRGVLATAVHSDGSAEKALCTNGGPSMNGVSGYVQMNGAQVFRRAVDCMASVSRQVLDATGLGIDDVDWLVPHQANIRIMHSLASKLGIDQDKVVNHIADHANTSAASIPLALAAHRDQGRLKPGQCILAQAVGGGLSWAGAVIRW